MEFQMNRCHCRIISLTRNRVIGQATEVRQDVFLVRIKRKLKHFNFTEDFVEKK